MKPGSGKILKEQGRLNVCSDPMGEERDWAVGEIQSLNTAGPGSRTLSKVALQELQNHSHPRLCILSPGLCFSLKERLTRGGCQPLHRYSLWDAALATGDFSVKDKLGPSTPAVWSAVLVCGTQL